MPDETPGPKPGHFLPGGAGDGTAVPEPSSAARSKRAELSKPEPLPPATGGSHLQQRPFGRSDARGKRPEDPPAVLFEPPRRFSKPVIAGIAVLALLVATGGVAVASQLMKAYDDLLANPLSDPSIRPSSTVPSQPESSPSSSASAVPTPDAFVVQQNALYATGRLAPSRCEEPSHRPTSKANVQKYFVQMVRCLDASWGPAIQKAKYTFRSPKLVLDTGSQDCTDEGEEDNGNYCSADETLYLPWHKFVDDYRKHKLAVRAELADSIATIYGFHVQHLTGIADASDNRVATASTKAAELEESRRIKLQAGCLAAVHLGANKQWHPWRGKLLEAWKYAASHSGDRRGKPRRFGSVKSHEYWTLRGFHNPDPKYCNTFTAPSAKVS